MGALSNGPRRLAGAALLLVATLAQQATGMLEIGTADVELTAFEQDFFITPAQMGVEHMQIVGEAADQTVLLHVWCRLVRHNHRNLFYGKAFFEEAQGNAFLPHHEQFITHLPELTLRGEKTHREHAIKVVKHSEWPIHLEADFEDSSKIFRFTPKGWKRFRQIIPQLVYDLYHKHTKPELPGVIGVFSAVYTEEHMSTFFVKLVTHNIMYHLRLGYAGMVVYVRPNTMKFLWASSTLRQLVKEKKVVLVMWTAVANLADAHGVYFDQWLICNHATVAFWQQHVYLNFLDPDEYLASPEQLSIQELLRGCMTANADMYRFLIYNLACDGCKYSERHNDGERDMWMDDKTGDPLKHYRRMNIPLGRGSKIFMNPNFAITLYNHWADMAENAITREVEGNCAYMAHLVHLFWYRPHTVRHTDFSENTTWWWVWDDKQQLMF